MGNSSLINDNDFKKIYLESLKARLMLASLDVEYENTSYSSAREAMRLYGQFEALKYSLNNDKTSLYDLNHVLTFITDIVDKLTNGEVSQYRNIDAEVVGSHVKRCDPRYIRMQLQKIVDDYNFFLNEYYKNGNEDSFYINEALFHINFLRIHPFEDANGRCARILLTRNFILNGKAPCIITKETKRQYCDFIENNDIDGMAAYFKEFSNKEEENMMKLYKNIKK